MLRALQEGEIERLRRRAHAQGQRPPIAATNVDLQKAVNAGTFRRDLYYRLNVYPVTIPPLRERTGDIPALVEAMVRRFETLHGKRIAGISDKAMHALKLHAWPGNVRELENVLERGVILAPQNGQIEVEHLFIGTLDEHAREHSLSAQGGFSKPRDARSRISPRRY